MINWKNIKQQLQKFLKTELEKTGFKKVTVGLSGGLDSAVVAILCKETFSDNMSVVLMPSQFSSKASIDDAVELCEKFNINYEIKSIAPIIKSYLENMDDNRLRIGNFSARIRMSILYDISSRDSSIVVGTSNKSELLLGYGTIFGDIACAINPIGDIYKSDEFEFAKFLGVTNAILNKKPSADLWEGQSDEEDLGYTYECMDMVLKLLVDQKKSKKEVLALGYDEKLIDTLEHRMKINAFKNRLPIIAKIKWS